jgi:hypothetical protein
VLSFVLGRAPLPSEDLFNAAKVGIVRRFRQSAAHFVPAKDIFSTTLLDGPVTNQRSKNICKA